MADQLLGELHDTEVKTAQSNGHINALLKPENPPQSVILKKTSVDDVTRNKVRENGGSVLEIQNMCWCGCGGFCIFIWYH